MLPIISVLGENTLLKTACLFLLLLIGFDTLTYRKDYDRSPILVGHQLAPPSMKVLVTATLQMVGVQSIGSVPAPAVVAG